ncbi:zinc finger protein ZAT8-like [Papaver somniferum]|uniref:zinc finger protein ZAT8-like n=1 Tax=Papaver somniferum TaxID=3469 RepID=UPI000E70285D|nr:zinc finger protein ZAT8-like [Papaver somniferum]
MLDSAKKTNSEATHKQIPILSTAGSRKFSCGNCGKSFSCHQALGGHKSTCNSNFSIREVGESSLQGLMGNKNKNSATSKGGPHECRICGKTFPNGWALGGHKRSHRTGQVEPSSRSSVSPKEITKESLHPINSFTSSVPEAQD